MKKDKTSDGFLRPFNCDHDDRFVYDDYCCMVCKLNREIARLDGQIRDIWEYLNERQ